jgi:hypothetical protein
MLGALSLENSIKSLSLWLRSRVAAYPSSVGWIRSV